MDNLLHTRFESQACRMPDAPALSDGKEKLTYRELNFRANQLAHRLRDSGAGPESLVGIYMDRSVETVVAILAVLKAGGAYVPMDLASPPDRLTFMLEDSCARILLTKEEFLTSLPPYNGKVICNDKKSLFSGDGFEKNMSVPVKANGAAYVIYTSGSTGQPKGVIITHQNVTRLFDSTDEWFRFSEKDTWTLFHSFAFDFSVWEMWGALLYGGRLLIVPHLMTRSPQEFYELLSQEQVTVLNQTPSAFRQLIWAEGSLPKFRPLALRYVIFGGEALELQSLAPWFARHGDASPQLVNMYGITETTVHVTYRPIVQADIAAGRGSVIGKPIPDLKIFLMDEHQKLVAPGEPGEICVEGAGLARGYLNRAQLTAEKFILNPFGSAPQERLYRSGDLARLLPGGDLEYLGRIDQQVKVRGFRIELGEIESALNRHPAVKESVVMLHPGPSDDKRLVAYLVCHPANPTTTELRAFLKKSLPDYMVPASFTFLQALPLTINGKVDREALPMPGQARPPISTPFAAPNLPTEIILADIWAEMLEVEQVGIHDNFFELGGDSIRSIRVLASAQERGIHFSLQQLFQTPTIYHLVRNTSGRNEDDFAQASPFSLLKEQDRAKLPTDLENAYPMAVLQTGMIFHSHYNSQSAIFHDVFTFRLNIPFNPEVLRKALERLVARHAIFRTSFDLINYSEPLQLVHKIVSIPFTAEDLRHTSVEQQQWMLTEWVEAEKRRPFDWAKAPLMRLHVQEYGSDTFQFIVSFHHVIMDGWSLAVMLAELFTEYCGALQSRDIVITPPAVLYADFIRLEQKAIQLESAWDYWDKKLKNPTVNKLPRWPKALRKGGTEQVRGPEINVNESTFESLKRLAQTAGVPLRTVLLATHCRVMSWLTGQSDLLTGLVTNGRPQVKDGERLIGLFLNTLPLRLELKGGTWHDLVRKTFEAERELIPFRRTPLAHIQNLSKTGSLFETAFDFVQFHVYRDIPGYQQESFLEGHYFEANNFTFFATFMLDATSTRLQFHFDYDPNELCEEQIKRICDYYGSTLSIMADQPESNYETWVPLPEAERKQLLSEWNQTTADYNREVCIHQMFEAQAGRTPEAVAASFEGCRLNYRELNQRANQVAAHLRKLGIHPDMFVGIFMDRSLEMLAGMLGVLKAGGAYVPLDPALPKERIDFMVEDAKIQVVLTQNRLRQHFAASNVEAICVDVLVSELAKETDLLADIESDVRPESLAYMIYTSGSTGMPKGVQIEHRSAVNFLHSMCQSPGLTSEDILLAVTTISFDIAGLELLLPLVAGAQVVIATAESALVPTELTAQIESRHITVMQATPSTWRMLVDSGWQGSPQLKVLCGGEALSPELAIKLRDRCDTLWNLYGPTETTIWSSLYKVETVTGPIPIGRPIANTQLYVLDAHLQPVPVGSQGDLYIGGDGLARGYLNRPELTTEKFTGNPFDARPGARMYKTGDIAKHLSDGNLVYVGRSDYQVKVHGFRIELGEIEAALEQQSSVFAAVAVTDQAAGSESRLIAYWIPKQNATATSNELRAYLGQRLPAYMVPSQFVQLTEFPLTPNGKVDRSKLPKPNQEQLRLETKYVSPGTTIEVLLAGMWQEVLKVERIGIHDNFFDTGGHSLAAIQIISRINYCLGVLIAVPIFFSHPTITQLSQAILERLPDTFAQEMLSGALDEINALSEQEAKGLLGEHGDG
jgi:amino acid adenylation domain-containing protein